MREGAGERRKRVLIVRKEVGLEDRWRDVGGMEWGWRGAGGGPLVPEDGNSEQSFQINYWSGVRWTFNLTNQLPNYTSAARTA